MSQQPVGYGWFGQPTPQNLPPTEPNPWAPPPQAPVPYSIPYGQPVPFIDPSGIPWQQPPAPTGFAQYPTFPPPQQPQSVGGIGFGFDCLQPPAARIPSAPTPDSSGPPVQTPHDFSKQYQTGPTVDVTKPEEQPTHDAINPQSQRKITPSPKNSINVSNNTPSSPDQDDHHLSTRYQEGLKNMAELMDDVELDDEVLRAVKSRFDLGH